MAAGIRTMNKNCENFNGFLIITNDSYIFTYTYNETEVWLNKFAFLSRESDVYVIFKALRKSSAYCKHKVAIKKTSFFATLVVCLRSIWRYVRLYSSD